MPQIRPFRAFRYSDGLRKQLSRLVCPPYDIISAKEQKSLLKRHVGNMVHVELPPGPGLKKYAYAAKVLKRWIASGIFVREKNPAFYFYEATFASLGKPSKTLVRRGFYAALRQVPWGRGVYPHEKTLPTAKADRLRLFKALHVQTSSVQCMFHDPAGAGQKMIDSVCRRRPDWDFSDDKRVRHRVWIVTDPRDIRRITRLMVRRDAVIADGHHRYETMRVYGKEMGGLAARHTMTYFSSAADKGLEVMATHRAVDPSKKQFVQLERWGRLIPIRDYRQWVKSKSADPRDVCVFLKGKSYVFRFRRIPSGLKGTPAARLAVACLHAGPLDGLGKEDFFFTRDAVEAARWATRCGGWAFFVKPLSVQDIVDVARAGQVLPPKSTYFYPKLPSGLALYPLKG
ncbi:MAG TPA: DUF1015 domain-containing protein [Elusimicrobiota bacterium]|nr:DUF1015 domain-containing protein [Elusimicrobiota bacterium]